MRSIAISQTLVNLKPRYYYRHGLRPEEQLETRTRLGCNYHSSNSPFDHGCGVPTTGLGLRIPVGFKFFS
jgi:hypothetical protein